jgi:hypothetical protein
VANGRDRRLRPAASEEVGTVAELHEKFERRRRRHIRLGRLLRRREAEAEDLNTSSRGHITTDVARERVGYHGVWSRWSASYDAVATAADRLLHTRPRSLSDLCMMFGALEWVLLADAVIVDSDAERQIRRFGHGLRQLSPDQ